MQVAYGYILKAIGRSHLNFRLSLQPLLNASTTTCIVIWYHNNMDKVKEFQHFLEVHLDELTRSIVFNRNPISIEFHKGDFYSKVLNEFVRLNDIPQEVINPDIPKEELVEVAKQLRRYNRSKHKVTRRPKLKPM